MACVFGALSLVGCKPPSPEPKVAGTPKAAAAAQAVNAGPQDPCALLTHAEVLTMLPGAKAPVRDDGDRQFGISACVWVTAAGRVTLRTYNAAPKSLGREMGGLAITMIDPAVPRAADRIRMEIVPGLGDGAISVVEKANATQGIRSSNALLGIQRGERIAILMAPELAEVDRAAALQSLATLGRNIAPRL
jgi:hypothetical protein